MGWSNQRKQKNIPTYYEGVAYKSKFLAKWGEYFHKKKLDFKYELFTFQLQENIFYRPTFFIYEWKAFIEIKYKGLLDMDKILEYESCIKRLELPKDFVYNTKVILIVGEPGREEKMILVRSKYSRNPRIKTLTMAKIEMMGSIRRSRVLKGHR